MDQLVTTHTYPFSSFALEPKFISHPLQSNDTDCGAFIAHFGLELVSNPHRSYIPAPDCSFIRHEMLRVATAYEEAKTKYLAQNETQNQSKPSSCQTCHGTSESVKSPLYNEQLLEYLCTRLKSGTGGIDESLANAIKFMEDNSPKYPKKLRPPHIAVREASRPNDFYSDLKLRKDFQKNPKKIFQKITEKSNSVEDTPTHADLNSYFSKTVPTPTNMQNLPGLAFKSFPDLSTCNEIIPQETLYALKACGNSAPGSDGIKFKDWRCFDPKGEFLTALFNRILKDKNPPMSWRTFRTVLILKPGSNVDPKMVSNWRPIAVLDSSYRLFSKILNTRLLNWISIGDLLSPVQKAVGHSDGCAEHNYLLTALTEKSKRCQTDLHICWLDLADAFGSVPHDVIWLTLDKMGLNPETLAVIQKLYEGSESIYQCQDTFSEPIKILQGVKQGCPLSMTIFCLAIDFLISGSSATQDIPKIQEKPVSILAYADDLVLLANTRAQLQILVNRIVDLASWAHLRFKPAKCGYHSTLNPTTVNSIKIYNTPIAVIDKNHTYKYLGVPHGSPKRHSIKDLMDQALKDFEAVIASKLTIKKKIST